MSIENYNNSNKQGIKIDLDDYHLFIIPTENEKGETEVFIKAYCSDHNDDGSWMDFEDWFNVEDGGSCYFTNHFVVPDENGEVDVGHIVINSRA